MTNPKYSHAIQRQRVTSSNYCLQVMKTANDKRAEQYHGSTSKSTLQHGSTLTAACDTSSINRRTCDVMSLR